MITMTDVITYFDQKKKKNDFNSIMVKRWVRVTELLKEKEASNFRRFVSRRIVASHD